MSAQSEFGKPWVAVEDYLAAERLGDIKHEYIDGQVYAMSVASRNDDRIAGNVIGEWRNPRRNQTAEAFTSNLKVKADQHSFNPDRIVVGDEFEPHRYYAEPPVRIVEVLSKSTRRTDEIIKRRLYPTIPRLLEYVPIEQDIVDDEVCRCGGG